MLEKSVPLWETILVIWHINCHITNKLNEPGTGKATPDYSSALAIVWITVSSEKGFVI